jgi:hypothetical protein
MPLEGVRLLLPGEFVLLGVFVLVAGVFVLVLGVLVFALVFGVLFVLGGVFVLVPEAAKATAGATEMSTGTLQPAFSSVRLETRNDRSGRSVPSDRPS